jgi:hypothetical protein
MKISLKPCIDMYICIINADVYMHCNYKISLKHTWVENTAITSMIPNGVIVKFDGEQYSTAI